MRLNNCQLLARTLLFVFAVGLAGCQRRVGGVYTINQANDDPTANFYVVEEERKAEDAKSADSRKK